MAAQKTAYRVQPRFKLMLETLEAKQLTVRQIGEDEFIILVEEPASQTEYILASRSTPDEPRTFTNLGRCAQAAVRLFGLKTIQFDLPDVASSEDPTD